MSLRMKSFVDTPGLNFPVTVTFMLSGTLNQIFPVAQTAAISVRPMPVEKAPYAP